ncbi:MAG: histidine phosphatase family protein [Alphaproteobacteria bacterium]|nr:MAG: histidine phosphatase family protein [Alphaproteobacteria bacterium]
MWTRFSSVSSGLRSMEGPRYASDGALRRRIYLFRHGDVSYVGDDGLRVPDPRIVPLTDWGQEQAKEMGGFLASVHFDKAACSGLLRTVQTAKGILGDRGLELVEIPEMEEIRSSSDRSKMPTTLAEAAYAFMIAHEPGATYRGGEAFQDFETRVLTGLQRILAWDDWHSLALVLHGGVNRIILSWALNTGLHSFGNFEQNTCCLNILDVDTDPATGEVMRTLVRGFNITAYDTARQNDHLTTLEAGAAKYRNLIAKK